MQLPWPASDRPVPEPQPFDSFLTPPEFPVQVHHILFIIWFVVFIFWLFKQFSAHNDRKGR